MSSNTCSSSKGLHNFRNHMSRKTFGANKGWSFSTSLSHCFRNNERCRKCVSLGRTSTEWTAGNFLWYYNIDNHTTLDMVVRGVGGMPAATVHGAQGAHTSAKATTIYGSWFLKGKGKSGQKMRREPSGDVAEGLVERRQATSRTAGAERIGSEWAVFLSMSGSHFDRPVQLHVWTFYLRWSHQFKPNVGRYAIHGAYMERCIVT